MVYNALSTKYYQHKNCEKYSKSAKNLNSFHRSDHHNHLIYVILMKRMKVFPKLGTEILKHWNSVYKKLSNENVTAELSPKPNYYKCSIKSTFIKSNIWQILKRLSWFVEQTCAKIQAVFMFVRKLIKHSKQRITKWIKRNYST